MSWRACLQSKMKGWQRTCIYCKTLKGAGLAPFDCWICLRGIKTMALRVEKQQENAQKIAEFLSSHPRVKKVYYAGLPSHPGYSLHHSQAKGAGSVLSFETGSVALSRNVTESTKYFITVSFGSVKSLISMPCFMSHSVIPAAVRESKNEKLFSEDELSHGPSWLIGRHAKTAKEKNIGKDDYVQQLTSEIRKELAVEMEEKVNKKVRGPTKIGRS